MSEAKAKPKLCSRGCGAMVYFDKNSTTGHPSPDRWIPLEVKLGLRTDMPHNCPKRNGGGTLDAAAAAATTTPSVMVTPDSLKFAETLSQILQDYVRLKRQETAAGVK